jgi:GH43 family beta-xylosidase
MTQRNGWYYLSFTTGSSVEIWSSRHMTDWTQARKKVVWHKPDTGPMSNDIWAPEVHWLDNRWYIYFSATNDAPERDPHRRIYVLQSVNTDIFGGYILRGQIRPTDATNTRSTAASSSTTSASTFSGQGGRSLPVDHRTFTSRPWSTPGR